VCNLKISYISKQLLFRGIKAKDLSVFYKIRIESAKEFKRGIQNPNIDVYTCLVSFVG
jgi:hypothetical protein